GEPRASALELLRAHFQAFGLPAAPEDAWIGGGGGGAGGGRPLRFGARGGAGGPTLRAAGAVPPEAAGGAPLVPGAAAPPTAPLLVQSEADPEPATFRPTTPVSAATALLVAGGAAGLGQPGAGPVAQRLVYLRDERGLLRLSWQVDVGALRTFVDAESGLVTA